MSEHIQFIVLSLLTFLLVGQSAFAFDMEMVEVDKDVYALIGETGPRTYENHALNNNIGFIIADKGVILIDSGASPSAAKLIQQKISTVTNKPVKWVINTGSQDHRWLGNSYFINKGAEVIALGSTVEEQQKHVDDHIARLRGILKENSTDIKPVQASRILQLNTNKLDLGGVQLELNFLADSHFPGDGVVWLPGQNILFSGDLIYVDRILGIQSYTPVASWLSAFNKMLLLKPQIIIPGHGSVSDLTKVQSQTGDYLQFLISGVSAALKDWRELDETVDTLTQSADQFRQLSNFDSWHKLNINRTYLQLEAGQ